MGKGIKEIGKIDDPQGKYNMIEAKEGIMENYINWCMKSKKNKFKNTHTHTKPMGSI